MKKSLSPFLAGGALLVALSAPLLAQPGDGPPRGRGFDGPREGGPQRGPRAKGELMRLWRGIGELEKGNSPLSRAQASQVVALVLPISKKQSLTDADATKLSGQLRAILTDAQRAAVMNGRGPRKGGPGADGPGAGRGPREGGPGAERGPGFGAGGPGAERGPRAGKEGGGPPRPGSAEFEKTRAFRDALNPFYPPTGYTNWKNLPESFQKNTARHWGENRAILEGLSRKAKNK